jgi:hypothetical protein
MLVRGRKDTPYVRYPGPSDDVFQQRLPQFTGNIVVRVEARGAGGE